MNAANNKSSEQSKCDVDSFRSMYVGRKTTTTTITTIIAAAAAAPAQ